MSARDEILARVRAAAVGAPAPVPREYRRTGTGDRAVLVGQLADRLADYRAGVHHIGDGELAAAVARVLAQTTTLVVPADLPEEWLAGYPGAVRRDDPAVEVLDEPGVSVLTGCAVAIAETGTIVLDAGAAQGRRALTLVPDHHVCVVCADQIVATVPEALARLTDPGRPLTFISGPSATSDIELDRVEGVHGPRTLDVIITGRTAASRLVEREARLARNAQMFERTAAHRVPIPDELSPEKIVREGRDAGFDIDRDQGSE